MAEEPQNVRSVSAGRDLVNNGKVESVGKAGPHASAVRPRPSSGPPKTSK